MLNYDIQFKNTFEGTLKASRVDVNIGMKEGEASPYELLFGALASCLYATFLEVLDKKKLSFESCTINVTGDKRKIVPTTLEWVKVEFRMTGAKDLETKEKAFTKSAELATKYCSIFQTLAQVAEMDHSITFNQGE